MNTFEENKQAFLNPQIGDYWNEMAIPYFLIVDKIGSLFIVVIAKRDNDKTGYFVDIDRPLVYSKVDIEDEVKYSSVKGKPLNETRAIFVANVWHSEKINAVVKAYHDRERDKAFKDRLRELIKRKKKQVRAIKNNPEILFYTNKKIHTFNNQDVIYYEYTIDKYLSEKPFLTPKIKIKSKTYGVEISKFLNGVWVQQPDLISIYDLNFLIKESGWITLPDNLQINLS